MRGSNLAAPTQNLLSQRRSAYGKVPAQETRNAQPAESANEDAGAVALDRCK